MSLSTTTLPNAAALPARTRNIVRSAQASNDFRTLDGERHSSARMRGETRPTATITTASRSGTVSGAPLWNGPTLRPAFVAQVIGQVMMDEKRSAPSAYREALAQIPPGSFIDDAV
jgi:hypothetical protein